jgi:hypothetical protein
MFRRVVTNRPGLALLLAVVLGAILFAAGPANAITTTTSLIPYDGTPGHAIQLPPPTTLTVLQGTPVVLQGWIQPGGPPNPTGSITFYDGAQVLGAVPITYDTYPCSFVCSAWQAKFTTSTLSVGVHSITAVYGGDGLYEPSTSNVATVTINVPPPPTTIATTTSLIPYDGTPGQSIQLPPPTTLTVRQGTPVVLQGWIQPGAHPNPTGSITFYDGAQVLGAVPITYDTYPCTFICSAWQAKFTTSTLSVGVHSITAVYGGDGLYEPSTSNVATVTINATPPPPTTIATTTSLITYDGTPGQSIQLPPPTTLTVPQGTPVVLQGWIQPSGQPNPGGSIAFYDGAEVLAAVPITYDTYPCSFICDAWQAKFTTSTLSVGIHVIMAVYLGDGLYERSTSNAATVTVTVTAPPPLPVAVVEFYNASFDHYFISADTHEIHDLDTGVHPGWTRTGLGFNAYAPGSPTVSPVCRFYIPPTHGDSHFFGRDVNECDATHASHPEFDRESSEVFDVALPVAGICPYGTVPVYRVFSNRADANHRYTTNRAVRDQMIARGWLAEGDGPDLVVICAAS